MKKFFIGIDVSKETLDATFLFKEDHSIENYIRVENSNKGFRELLKWAKDCAKALDYKLSKAETWFCCENTGSYSVNLCEFIASRHMEIAEEHPAKIYASRSVQRGKTDKGDSLAIADYAMRYEDKLSAYLPPTDDEKKLRALLDYRADLVKEMIMNKNRLHSKSVLKGNKHNPGLMRRDTEKRIKALAASIKAVEAEINALISSVPEMAEIYGLLTSFKGVGPVNAVTLMVRTGNFKRFDYNARKLASYYGCAPFPWESGTSVKGRTKVSKKADKSLKAVLTQSALCAIKHNRPIKEYYQRLVEMGKHQNVALNNVKNKILHILVAMVKNKTEFDPNFVKMQYA